MSEREALIQKLRGLYAAHNVKQRRHQEEHNLGPEVGCITRELCEIGRFVPQMLRLGITPMDCQPDKSENQ